MSALSTIRRGVAARRYRNDLMRLAYVFGTDKWGQHWYMQHYQHHFAPRQHESLNILEIGVGGHADTAAGGNSLRVWKRFFRNSRIYGIDVHDKRAIEEPRIRTFQGQQADAAFLRRVAADIGPLDIVIDDGSHVNRDVIASFDVLFPLVRARGIYAVEDVSSSYAAEFGGDSDPHGTSLTIMRYFKALLDGLHTAAPAADRAATQGKKIAAVHFYQDLIVLEKSAEPHGQA